jgi:hypothetical protein
MFEEEIVSILSVLLPERKLICYCRTLYSASALSVSLVSSLDSDSTFDLIFAYSDCATLKKDSINYLATLLSLTWNPLTIVRYLSASDKNYSKRPNI